MSSRLFAYNSGAPISGASQSGSLAISNNFLAGGSVKWWNGPNEQLGYVIAYTDTSGTRKSNGVTVSGGVVGFRITSSKTDSKFLSLANNLTGQNFLTASVASNWLNTNGYYSSYSGIIQSYTAVGSVTWTAPSNVNLVEYLLVAGGGGGGNGYDTGGGAGGGGGMVLIGSQEVTPGQSYTITVGFGGTGGAGTRTNINGKVVMVVEAHLVVSVLLVLLKYLLAQPLRQVMVVVTKVVLLVVAEVVAVVPLVMVLMVLVVPTIRVLVV